MKSYVCINCGADISQLYKEYSSTVLKLTKCESCKEVADKYVEYDLSIVIIDLVLLKMEAYRHILHNTKFKFHWKLAIILHVIEAYYEWMLKSPDFEYQLDDSKEFTSNDLMFYNICLLIFIKTTSFVLTIYVLTLIYNKKKHDKPMPYKELFVRTWKSVTLSNFGLLLLIPSFVWGSKSALDNSLTFVTFFTTLSQLFSYRASDKYTKGWAVFVILTSHVISILCHYYSNHLINRYLDLGYISSPLKYLL